MRARQVAVSTILLTMLAGPAAAYPVTWEFAGEITYVRDDDGLLGGAVTVGSPFSGLYTFESTTPDCEPDRPDVGDYDGAITAFSGEVAGLSFVGPIGPARGIAVLEFGITHTDLYSAGAFVDFVGATLSSNLTLRDDDGTALQGDSLPLQPPDLTLFEYRSFLIIDPSELIPIALRGEITALVPEPSTLVLLVACLVAVGAGARERFRR